MIPFQQGMLRDAGSLVTADNEHHLALTLFDIYGAVKFYLRLKARQRRERFFGTIEFDAFCECAIG